MATVAVTHPSPASAAPSEPADHPPSPIELVWGVGGACKFDLKWIAGKLSAVADELGTPVGRLAVRVVGDAEMAKLHERHAGVAGTTDVLTFATNRPGEPVNADIAICLDEAARRAAEFGHSIERELLLYAVHGLLHCAGFDDRTPADHARMHAEEDRLLEAVGVGRTFAPRGDRDCDAN